MRRQPLPALQNLSPANFQHRRGMLDLSFPSTIAWRKTQTADKNQWTSAHRPLNVLHSSALAVSWLAAASGLKY
jgi:hypothetical protein